MVTLEPKCSSYADNETGIFLYKTRCTCQCIARHIPSTCHSRKLYLSHICKKTFLHFSSCHVLRLL